MKMMEKHALSAAAVVLTLCLVCGALFNQPSKEFDDNKLLTCYITNPFFATGRDQPERIAEEPPTIPLQPINELDEVWQPVSSGFPLPHVRPKDLGLLAGFIGNDLDIDLQAIEEPSTEPPDNCPANSNNDSFINQRLTRITDEVGSDSDVCFVDYIRRIECQLNFTWTQLPKTFFPRWYYGGYCPQSNCSIPIGGGAFCAPNVSSNTTLTVLRWDCCWSLQENKQWEWDCGWRKVRFPIVCDCDCGCGERRRAIQK